jgi:hypothetical protein
MVNREQTTPRQEERTRLPHIDQITPLTTDQQLAIRGGDGETNPPIPDPTLEGVGHEDLIDG